MAVLLTYCVQLGLFPVLWCLTVWLYKFNSSNFLIHVSSGFPLNSMVGRIVNFGIVVGKRRVVKIISLERNFAVSFLTCLYICCSVAQPVCLFVTPWTTGVTRSLKSLLQHHNLKASILRNSAFCYGPALTSIHNYWKTIALAIGTFVGKVRSLLFNMLFVKGFLPRSKHLLIYAYIYYCCSVAQSCLTLWPHGLQHTRLPWPSPSPWVCSNSCPLSQWCHPTISSSVVPFSSCPQSFPASGTFAESSLHIRWPKYWSFSLSTSNAYSGLISFRIDWLDFLEVQGILKSLLSTTAQKHQFFGIQPSLWSNSHIHTWLL